ncbi:hypothetical protein PYW08_003375 [Mythimna loreyi]|uniref:Uncharacterized protein n=1 Tax=Mythimna loreyi TaxID=667449 RepID=A0ACC2QW65_9NEOP|nr:hypothetical protein PYW08_003375 [Mythimna loreyi]
MLSRKSSTATTPLSTITERRVSQYEGLMKRYSDQHVDEKCKFEEIMPRPRSHAHKHFATGSSYQGPLNVMGMNGYGEYTFPNGVLYRGEFQDGQFHGPGELLYNEGPEADCVIRGTWVNGVLTDRKILFNGNLEYEEDDWKYCKIPDRRYAAEFEKDLQPAGKSLVTPDVPPREIPPGCYDCGDGYYHPETKVVYSYENPNEVTRGPSARERKWIVDNCRTLPLKYVGPRSDFYETWLPPVEKPEPPPEPSVAVKYKGYTKVPFIFEEDSTERFEPFFFDSSLLEGSKKK